MRLPGFEWNKVGFWLMWLSSYRATFGKVSSAFKMGKVLLKNSNVLALKSSLKNERVLVSTVLVTERSWVRIRAGAEKNSFFSLFFSVANFDWLIFQFTLTFSWQHWYFQIREQSKQSKRKSGNFWWGYNFGLITRPKFLKVAEITYYKNINFKWYL